MSAFVCCTRRGLAEELAAKTRAKGLECGQPRHRNARQVAPRNPVTKAARNFSADQVTSQGTFSLFFFFWGGPVLVMNNNDFMVVSLVYRQAKGFAHGELSESWRFSMGRVSVSYITDLEVRR